ncbi:nuclear protein 96-domain-containing protein [Limtongia smithiae]|uniref:nuclear protein 96-domain-containing protein n=1 Tax=Limtongia smithiae TaxID=1125753 RepID=UPI0034CEF934
MFGSGNTGSGFGGFGTNTSNPGSSLFGTTTTSAPAFGSTTTTSTSPFGQSQGFQSGGTGLFGQPSTTQTSGFGAFGSTARPAFGASNTGFGTAANTGGSLFGSTPTATTTSPFGSSNAFGATNNAAATTSPFGQPATGGLFGSAASKPAGSAFGGFGSAATTNTATPAFGTGLGSTAATTNQGTVTPFDPLKEKEPTSNVTSVYQSITCMPAYQAFSFEELREQDYAQGRRFGNGSASGAGAFGKPTGFGSTTFGQSSTSAFGQPAANTGGGLFGSTTAAQPSAFGGGGFGSTTNTNTGLFGQQKPAAGGLFGATATPTTNTGGLFGSATTGTNNSAFGQTNSGFGGASAFGQPAAPKPAFGAAASPSFGSAFGSTAATTTPAFGASAATPAFGAPASTTTGSLFGNAGSTSTFGQTKTTPSFGFGATNTTANPAPSFGGFGAATTQNKPALNTGFGTGFGSSTGATNTTSGMFGQPQPQQNKPATFGTGFGNGFQQPSQPASTGLFGAPASTAQPAPSLFGAPTTASTGMFGNLSANQSTTSGGMFGAKPQTSLFGSTPAQQQPTTSLFGNTPTVGGFGGTQQPSMFGSSMQQPSGGMFGASQSMAQSNPLQASIDQNPFGSNPLFSYSGQPATSSPGPIATPLSTPAQKKKPALLPTYKLSPQPLSGHSKQSPSSTRHVSASLSSLSSSSSASPPLTTSRSLLFDGLADRAILTSEAFSPRNGIRKLVIDRNVTESSLLTGSESLQHFESPQKSPEKLPAPVFVKPATQTAAPAKLSAVPAPAPLFQTPVVEPAPEPVAAPNTVAAAKPVVKPQTTPAEPEATPTTIADKDEMENDGYWSSPSGAALRKMSLKQLEHVESYTVGRKGYGEVSFNSAVDLSTFAHPDQIPGQLVLFGSKSCTVYPDDSIKPENGKGLNVPATITLENCFPISKEDKKPIKEVDHPIFTSHIERLKKMKGTKFLTYIKESGTWVFSIDHFSVWGLLDEEDEYETSTSEPVKVNVFEAVPQFKPMTQIAKLSAQVPAGFGFSPMKVDEPVQPVVATPVRASPNTLEAISFSHDSPNHSRLPGDWNIGPFQYAEDTPLRQKSLISHMGGGPTRIYPDLSKLTQQQRMQPEFSEDEAASEDDQEMSVANDSQQSRSVADEMDQTFTEDYDGDIVNPINVPVGLDWAEQLQYAAEPKSLWAALDDERNELLRAAEARDESDDYKFTFADLDEVLFGGDKFFEYETIGTAKNTADNNFASGKHITRKPVAKSEFSTLDYEFLKIHLDHAACVPRDGSIPLFRARPTLKFSMLQDFYSRTKDIAAMYTWRLAGILFDEIILEADYFNPRAETYIAIELERKARLSTFLEQAVSADIEQDLRSKPAEYSVFTLLSGHQIEEACVEAIKAKNLHLSSLLPLIGGDAEFRHDITNQIEDWTQTQTLSDIPVSLRRVYALLAGNAGIAKGVSGKFSEDSAPDVIVSEGLNWKRAFGLRLWYEIFEEDAIEKAVQLYEQAFGSVEGVAAPDEDAEEWDILFRLLKLYADKSYTVQDAVLSGKDAVDYSVAWQLFGILTSSRQIRPLDEAMFAAGDRLSLNFAWQLESVGRWVDAVFVVLYVVDTVVSEQAVQEILNRHVAEMDATAEAYLQTSLRVSRKMILMAKAQHARATGECIMEAQYLLDAGEWTEAHGVIVRAVGPNAVISERMDEDLLPLLLRFEDVTSILTWKVGGQVYLDYMNVVKAARAEEEGETPEDASTWWPRLVRGLPSVHELSPADSRARLEVSLALIDVAALEFVGKVAVKEMAKVVGVDV